MPGDDYAQSFYVPPGDTRPMPTLPFPLPPNPGAPISTCGLGGLTRPSEDTLVFPPWDEPGPRVPPRGSGSEIPYEDPHFYIRATPAIAEVAPSGKTDFTIHVTTLSGLGGRARPTPAMRIGLGDGEEAQLIGPGFIATMPVTNVEHPEPNQVYPLLVHVEVTEGAMLGWRSLPIVATEYGLLIRSTQASWTLSAEPRLCIAQVMHPAKLIDHHRGKPD
jgi:hypothetical protein